MRADLLSKTVEAKRLKRRQGGVRELLLLGLLRRSIG